MVIAVIALFAATAGSAIAGHGGRHGPAGLVNSLDVQNGSLTGADVKNRSLRPIDFRGSIRGPRGLRGPAGQNGTNGAPGQNGTNGTNGTNGAQGPMGPGARWAALDGTLGVIADQTGGITVALNQVGRYWIDFGTNITRKLVIVSLRDLSGHAHAVQCAGPAGIAGGCFGTAEDNERVYVQTRDAAGAAANRNFYLAVVGPDGVGTTSVSIPSSGSTGLAVP